MSSERVIWIVTEGSPGHETQSIGLCEELAGLSAIRTHLIQGRPKFGGFRRMIVRLFLMGRKGRKLSDAFLEKWMGIKVSALPADRPDLIVSSGGKSVFAARSLALRHGIPFVFIGERKPYPPEWFDLIFTPSFLENAACDTRIDLIPTKIRPAVVEHAAEQWVDRPEGRLWAMLIGGSSRSHRYEEADWKELGKSLGALAKREGVRWLVSTSRRTGKEVEQFLMQGTDPSAVANATWWCHEPKRLLAAYLGAAERVFVTQDSMSMITEAVASGKPVVVIYPRGTTFPRSSFMVGYLENLERKGAITRIAMDELQRAHFDQEVKREPLNDRTEMGRKVLQFLGWKTTELNDDE